MTYLNDKIIYTEGQSFEIPNSVYANEIHRQINQSRHILYYLVGELWLDIIEYLRSDHEKA